MTTVSTQRGRSKLLSDPAGIEEAIRAVGPINFNFAYKGMAFHALFAETPQGALLSMVGTIGTLPYSAQSSDARRTLLTIIASANSAIGKFFRVSKTSRIELHCATRIEEPANAANLIVAAAQALVPMLPYVGCITDNLPQSKPARLIASAR
jgi:hypothetical protein